LDKKGCYIDHRPINGKDYYQAYEQYTTTREETEAPIYNMVLDLEAIEVHMLAKIIESKNGFVLDLATDCVSCVFPKEFPFELEADGVNVKGFYYDPNDKKSNRYKLEEKDQRLKVARMAGHKRSNTYDHEDANWEIREDGETNDFTAHVEHILDNRHSINIDGRAGTGKTTLIKKLQAEMTDRGLKYISLAPTNKACRLIDGTTIHRFASMCSSRAVLNATGADYVFVDEVSMVPEMFYKFFITMKRMKPDIKFIISGDFEQLLPVNDRVAGCDYKNSHALWELCDGNRLQLSKCRRSDDTLFNMLLKPAIDNLKKTDFEELFTERHLSFTNTRRKQVNTTMMDQMAKRAIKNKLKPLELEALDYDDNSQNVKLVANTPIIARKKCKDLDICNNETFVIAQVQHKTKIIKIKEEGSDRKLDIPFDDFQKMFYPAYCITIHKSQGCTFDHPYTIHEWDHQLFDERLKYVALSRSTSVSNIKVW
jgi:hypothetical protein